MERRRAIVMLCVMFVCSFAVGLRASFQWDQYRFADQYIYWYNGSGGAYYNAYQEEALTDGDSWHNGTIIDLITVGSPGSADQINSYANYYGATNWYGLAGIDSTSGWTILSATSYLNASYLDFESTTAKKHVACHEVGHTLGLDHDQSDLGSCLNDTNLVTPHPSGDDVNLLESIYGEAPPGDGPNILSADEILFPGQEIVSNDGRFRLKYQGDGNLVLYRWDNVALWNSNTYGTSAGHTIQQPDGNLVVYDANGTPVWHAGTNGNSGAYTKMQDDGNLVVYHPNGSPLWWSGTCCY